MTAGNDTLSYPGNFTPPVRASLFCAASCMLPSRGGYCLRREKCRIFVGVGWRQMLRISEFF